MPERIQLSRQRGWRKPEGAIVVARPTKWGNPFRWTDYPHQHVDSNSDLWPITNARRRRFAVDDFESAIRYGDGVAGYPSIEEIRAELAGRDLACWCPLVDAEGNRVPCHADVLLAIANSGDQGGEPR